MKKLKRIYLALSLVALLAASLLALTSCGDDKCKHVWDEGTTVDATCYNQGAIAYTCKKCGEIKTDLTPAKGHSFTNYVDNGDATCELEGTKTAVCDNGCGATDTLPVPKRHTYAGDYSYTADGHFHVCTTCGGNDGVAEHTPDENGFNCSVCGYAIHTHAPSKVGAKAATCTEKGNIEYWHCSVCNFNFSDAACTTIITKVETEPLRHSAAHIPAKAATCTEKGNVEAWYCNKCDKFYGNADCTSLLADADRILEKLNHTHTTLKKSETQHWYECSCGDVNTSSYADHISSGPATATTPETCTVCGYVIAPATSHTHVATHYEAKAATCTEDGNIEFYYCQGCEGIFSDALCQNEISEADVFIERTGHDTSHAEAKTPTCTENGCIEHWYCENCSKYFSDEALTTEIPESVAIKPARHGSVMWTGAVAPTCTKSGNIAYWHCQTCNKYFSDEALKNEVTLADTVIENTRHTVTPVAMVPATCTTPGVAAHYLCSNCKKSYTTVDCSVELAPADRVIDAPGHVAENAPCETVSSTCTTNGYLIFKCQNCDYKFRNGTLPLADCTWELKSETPATCQATGLQHYECSVCHETKSVVTPKTDHDIGAGVPVVPTCTEDGYTLFSCQTEGCGYSYRENVIGKLGHNYVIDEAAGKAATCTEDGKKVTICQNGCQYRFEETLSATGHSVSPTCEADSKCENCDYVASKTGHSYSVADLKAATCTEDGYIKYVCQNEGCEHPTKTEVPKGYAKTGHTAPENAVWTEETKPAADGVECHVYVERSTKCRDCDHIIVAKGDEHYEHNPIAIIDKDATCTEDGVKKYVCANCGKDAPIEDENGDPVYIVNFSNPDAHSWNEGVDQGNGTILYTCSKCSGTKTTVSAKTEQSATIDSSIVAGTTDIELEHATFVPDESVKGSLSGNVTFGAEEKDVASLGLPEDILDELSGSPVYDFTLKVNGSDVGSLNGTMKVRVPYTLDEGEDTENIVVFYINYGENYENDPTDITIDKYDAAYVIIDGVGYAEFETDHFSQYSVTKMSAEQRCNYYGHAITSVTVPKTCLTDGYVMNICTRCGHTVIETPDELRCEGHSWEAVEATKVTLTCEVDGYCKYKCSECPAEYEVKEAATGHEWAKDAERSSESTCTEAGESVYVCLVCESEKTETAPLKAHAYKRSVVLPTCTEDGYTKEVCRDCENTKISNRVAALGHKIIDEVHEATCLENGYTAHYCENCDLVLPVTPGEARSDTLHMWNVEAPTCTEDKVCEYCGTLAEGGRAIGHEFGANGVCVRTDCAHKCDHEFTFLNTVEASCIKPAHEVHQCTICLETKEVNFTGEKASHNMPDGICTICGLTSGTHYLSMIESWKNVNGFSIKLSDFSFSIEEYVSENTPWYVSVEAAMLDVAELMLYLDENGKLAGALNGKIRVTLDTFSNDTRIYGVCAAIEDGYIYLELLDGFDDISALNESYMLISLETVTGSLLNSIAEFDENGMIDNVLEWASDELLPILESFKNKNSHTIDEIVKNIINLAITEEITEDGFKYTLDYGKLRTLNENLAALPLSEFVDLYFGYGSYDKLISAIKTLANTKVPEIPALLDKIGLDSEELTAAINSLAAEFGKADFDINLIITDEKYKDLTLAALVSGKSAEDLGKMIDEISEGLKHVSLYSFFAPAETPEEMELGIEAIKKMVDDVIGEVEKIIGLSFETNTEGGVTFITLDINKLNVSGSTMEDGDGNLLSEERTTVSLKLEFTPNGRINLDTSSVITKINEYVKIPELDFEPEYEYGSSFYEIETKFDTIDFSGNSYIIFRAMGFNAYRFFLDLSNPIATTIKEICGDKYLSGIAYAEIWDYIEFNMYMATLEGGGGFAYILENTETGELVLLSMSNETTYTLTFEDGTSKTFSPANSDSENAMLEVIFSALDKSWINTSYDYEISNDLYILYDNKTGEYEFVRGGDTIHSLVVNEEKSTVTDKCEETSVYFLECEHCSYKTKYFDKNRHHTTEKYVLHEGSVSCDDGIDILYVCTKCDEIVSKYEDLGFGHVTLVKYTWDSETATLIAEESCLCGEIGEGRTTHKLTGGGEFGFLEYVDLGGQTNMNVITFTPEEDGVYEFYSKDVFFSVLDKNGDSLLDVDSDSGNTNSCDKHYDKNMDGICDNCKNSMLGGGNLGFDSSFDSSFDFIIDGIMKPHLSRFALTLQAGETYYIILSGGKSDGNIKSIDVSIRESEEISLEEYGCTCGANMTVTDCFDKKTVTLPEHTDSCRLTAIEQMRYPTEDCTSYETSVVIFMLDGEEIGEYELYRVVTGYGPHSDKYTSTYTRVDAVDEHGNLITVETRKEQYVCEKCGKIISQTVHTEGYDKKLGFSRFYKYEYYYLNEQIGEIELQSSRGSTKDRICFEDGTVEIKTIQQFDYYYKNGVESGTKTEYTYYLDNHCVYDVTETYSGGKVYKYTNKSHTEETKQIPSESGTETVYEDGVKLTLVTEATETYCSVCHASISKKVEKTYTSEDGKYVREETEYYKTYANSDTDYGYALTDKSADEFGVVTLGGEEHRYRLSSAEYYYENGVLDSFKKTVRNYKDGSLCEYTETTYTSENPEGWTDKYTYTNHLCEEYEYYLHDGSTSCEDGFLVYRHCLGCDLYELWDDREWGDHYSYETYTEYDLTEYGSTCGGTVTLFSCLCGKNKYVEIDTECDLDYVDGKHVCSVQEPWCDFEYYEVWERTFDENCNEYIEEYYVFGAGENKLTLVTKSGATGDVVHDMVEPEGERIYTEGIYKVTVTGGKETCSRCKAEGQGHEHYTYKIGDDVYKTEEIYYEADGNPFYKVIWEYIRFENKNDPTSYRMVNSLCRSEWYNNGILESWEETAYNYENNCPLCPSTTYTDSYGSNYSTEPEAHSSYELEFVETVQFPTCTQPEIQKRECSWCGYTEVSKFSCNGHDMYFDEAEGLYKCYNCGLKSEKEALGDFWLEELTKSYGNGEAIVIGYLNVGEDISFLVNISIDGDERALLVYMPGNENVKEGLIYVYVSDLIAAIEAFNTENGTSYDLCKDSIRISIVPVGGSSFDYHITLDPHVLKADVSFEEENLWECTHSYTCVICEQSVSSLTLGMSNSPDRYYKDENGISHRVYEYYCRDCGHRYRTDYYEVTENCTVTTFYDYLLLENGEYVFKYKENLGCYTYHSEDWVETTNGNSFTRSYACSDCGTALIATTVNAVMPDDVTLSFAENDFSRPLFEFTVSRSGKYLLYSSSVVDETYLDTIIVIKDENGNRLNEADGGADNGHFSTSFVFEEGITYYLEIGTYSSDGIDTFNFFVEYAN